MLPNLETEEPQWKPLMHLVPRHEKLVGFSELLEYENIS